MMDDGTMDDGRIGGGERWAPAIGGQVPKSGVASNNALKVQTKYDLGQTCRCSLGLCTTPVWHARIHALGARPHASTACTLRLPEAVQEMLAVVEKVPCLLMEAVTGLPAARPEAASVAAGALHNLLMKAVSGFAYYSNHC